MEEYELVVVGGGTANNVAAAAADEGIDTALVEKGPLGGTCLNRGCNPSKMLIQSANVAEAVRESERFGVESSLEGIDFGAVVEEMDTILSGLAEGMEEGYREKDDLTLYKDIAEFVGERTLELDSGDEIRGEKVVVAAGSRPLVPPIDGLDEADYLTSTEALYLDEAPDSLVIMGGGYIAVELGYFFEAMGTDVKIVEMMDSLVPREDEEVAKAFTDIACRRHDVYTGHRATEVETDGGDEDISVHAETEDGEETTVEGEKLLVALGRRPNTDTLGVEEAGIETDDNGFVVTNEYLETSAENVWAQGDIADNFMFKHSGDYETQKTIRNVVHGEREGVDFTAMPHAIFTEPQIAGVGETEEELRDKGVDYNIGRARYEDSAMGRAKKLDHGFVKVLAAQDGEILGCHIIGEEASVMIHQTVVAMRNGVTADEVADTIHVHPALNRIVESAFEDAV